MKALEGLRARLAGAASAAGAARKRWVGWVFGDGSGCESFDGCGAENRAPGKMVGANGVIGGSNRISHSESNRSAAFSSTKSNTSQGHLCGTPFASDEANEYTCFAGSDPSPSQRSPSPPAVYSKTQQQQHHYHAVRRATIETQISTQSTPDYASIDHVSSSRSLNATNIPGQNYHFQIQMKLVLLDSLLLRLKSCYGIAAETICDQALFACVLDIKKRCSQKQQVDLSILTEIDCVYQQLVDNENIYRLERHHKLEKEKLDWDTAQTQIEMRQQCQTLALEAKSYALQANIAQVSVLSAILLVIVGVFLALLNKFTV
jgi:uncharacterized membrane protein